MLAIAVTHVGIGTMAEGAGCFALKHAHIEQERNFSGKENIFRTGLAALEGIGGNWRRLGSIQVNFWPLQPIPCFGDTGYNTNVLPTYSNRFSAVFQLMTSQIAPKYSALRFWYCRLCDRSANFPLTFLHCTSKIIQVTVVHTNRHVPKHQCPAAA